MKTIDNFLNNITMYRLVLYYLIVLIAMAAVFGLFGFLPYSPISLLVSAAFLLIVSIITNNIFAKTFVAVTNVESVYISALILALIMSPVKAPSDFIFLAWAAVLTMASKYILAINNKHIFNPVAIAVALTSIFLGKTASWWVGTMYMTPFVLVGGLLIVRKIRRFDLVYHFFLVALAVILSVALYKGSDLFATAKQALFYSPLFFFAFVMLTEPLTTPPTKILQSIYGGLVGLFFAPQFHLGQIYFTPETALLVGNVFSYLSSPKQKLILKLKEKIRSAGDTYDFVFNTNQKPVFTSGQYMEWTLGHENADSRGNRRYLTIASSPTENEVRIGVKFYKQPSSFKKRLLELKTGEGIVAGQLAGDFVLPKDKDIKLAFIAGGIGITPFRSIIKFLLDTHQKRNAVLLYSNKFKEEIAYTDLFDQAQKDLGIKTVYTLTETKDVPPNWTGKTGFINEQMICGEIPDFIERKFYISGPQAMVTDFKELLQNMGLRPENIVTDYFPGFA